MKKYLLIIICMSLATIGAAQKIYFTDSTNSWISGAGGYYSGDTVIGSVKYQIMNSGGPSAYSSCAICGSNTFIREDTTLHKVFALMNSTEEVLMDYDLKVGDTAVHFDNGYDTTRYVVASIDSTLVNSIYYRVWHFTLIPPYHFAWAPFYSVVEGIGCTNGPLFSIAPIDFESLSFLCWFYNKGTSPALSPAVIECCVPSYFPSPDTFDNLHGCPPTPPDGVTVSGKNLPGYSISPNPVQNTLTIAATEPITTITVTNCVGQTMYTNRFNAEQVQIDVASLPSGIYFVRINGRDIKKFVRQ